MKYDRLEGYPVGATERVRTVLLTVWPSIPEAVQEDLVLVGGLAVQLHMQGKANPLGRISATLDVDLGISLGASAGCYDSLSSSLHGIGFREDERRWKRDVEGLTIAIDFLAEGPPDGGRMVDTVQTSCFLGIDRALASREAMLVSGCDVYGVQKTLSIPVASLGALMVLKLNAFAGRRHPKDAYDFLVLALAAPILAREALVCEIAEGNPGVANAQRCLESCFRDPDADGPRRALAFRDGEAALSHLDKARRATLQQMATMGQFLLD